MTQNENNPKSFPVINQGYVYEVGMDLRDYFASLVDGAKIAEGYSLASLEEIIGKKIPEKKIELLEFWFEVESKLQYMKADAMLKQRLLCY